MVSMARSFSSLQPISFSTLPVILKAALSGMPPAPWLYSLTSISVT
jgi:hypothetical protein